MTESGTASWGVPGAVQSPGETGLDVTEPAPRPAEEPWECQYCHFKPNLDTVSEMCQSCGRDKWGKPGKIPARLERDPRLNFGSDA